MRGRIFRAWLILTLAIGVALAGCSGGAGSPGGAGTEERPSAGEGSQPAAPEPTPQAQPRGPVKITMMNSYHADTPPKDDGPVITAIEEFTGVDLEMTWVPANVYDEKLVVTLASGELPQVIMADPLNPNIINSIEAGMFWQLDPYFDEFPNLATFNEIAMNNAKYKGKTYAVIRPRPVARGGVILRKDWLENVGLKEPATLDELYEVLLAFKKNDPDGNGVDDTYGFMQYEGYNRDLLVWAGAPVNRKVENGTFVKDVETPEYLEGMKFQRKLYEEGIMNPDFLIVERNVIRKDLYTGKVGASVEAFDAVVPYYRLQTAQMGVDMEFTIAAPINGRSYGGQGFLGAFLIPKSSVKTEEELKDILRYFDTQRSPEVVEKFEQLLIDNARKPDAEQFNIDNVRQFLVNDALSYPFGDSDIDVMIRERMEANNDSAVTVGDPSFGLLSPTYIERGGELDTILDDATAQFILGEIDESGFRDAVERWKAAGGAKVAEELAEQYNQ